MPPWRTLQQTQRTPERGEVSAHRQPLSVIAEHTAPAISSAGSVSFWHRPFPAAAAMSRTGAVGEIKPGTPPQYIIFIPISAAQGMLMLECDSLRVVPVNLQEQSRSNRGAQPT